MMPGGGYFSNAGVFLVDVLFGLYISAVMLRLFLQWVRADFYNPLSQAIVKLTNPPLRPLRRYIPAIGRIDTASVVLTAVLQLLNTWLVCMMVGLGAGPLGLIIVGLAEIMSKTVYIFVFSIIVQAVASWVAPGSYNPVLSLIDNLTDPLLRPVRRLLPPVGGLDLSPLVAIVLLQLSLMLIVAPIRDMGGMLL